MSSPRSPLGVYVHFPWCRARCPYCDFAIAVAPLAEIPHAAYAAAVQAELAARAPRLADRALRSIYFGGGTPALWDPRELGAVLVAVRDRFPAEGELEITVEANPDDCTPSTLTALRAAGVNRLSVGAQSFADGELVQLGREHDAAATLGALAAARAAGFDNVSLDLIFALPGRSLADFRRSLERALEVGPEHLSVYQLTVEPRTTFGERARRGELVPESDEASAEQFDLAHTLLGAAGYEHYEVSSYARPGRRARHNSLYWTGADYLGLGNGAHSLIRTADGGGERSGNHRSVKRYLASPPEATAAETSHIAADEMASDLVWLGLRTADGVPRHVFSPAAAAELARLTAAGLLVDDAARVRPTPAGLRLADALGARLADGLYFAGSPR